MSLEYWLRNVTEAKKYLLMIMRSKFTLHVHKIFKKSKLVIEFEEQPVMQRPKCIYYIKGGEYMCALFNVYYLNENFIKLTK